MNDSTDKKTAESKSTAKSAKLILDRIDAGIDAANQGKFATNKQVKKEFARCRDA